VDFEAVLFSSSIRVVVDFEFEVSVVELMLTSFGVVGMENCYQRRDGGSIFVGVGVGVGVVVWWHDCWLVETDQSL